MTYTPPISAPLYNDKVASNGKIRIDNEINLCIGIYKKNNVIDVSIREST